METKDEIIEWEDFKITLRKDGMLQVDIISEDFFSIIPLSGKNFVFKIERKGNYAR
jgi:hypothetical protein